MQIRDIRADVKNGLYDLSFAARLLQQRPATVRSWLKPTLKQTYPPALQAGMKYGVSHDTLSFVSLVEARFVAHLRKHGVSLVTLRRSAQKLRQDFKIDYPFARERFRTDGKRVMMEAAEDNGDRTLLDLLTDEFCMPDVIEPSLFATTVYIDDLVGQFQPFDELDEVIVNPKFSFGRPVVLAGKIPTETLAQALISEGDAHSVAEWYVTTVKAVNQAFAFEARLAA